MAKGPSSEVTRMLVIQIVYVFLFAFIMQSPTVYKWTDSFIPAELVRAKGTPSDICLAIHATVYVFLVFLFSQAMAATVKKNN